MFLKRRKKGQRPIPISICYKPSPRPFRICVLMSTSNWSSCWSMAIKSEHFHLWVLDHSFINNRSHINVILQIITLKILLDWDQNQTPLNMETCNWNIVMVQCPILKANNSVVLTATFTTEISYMFCCFGTVVKSVYVQRDQYTTNTRTYPTSLIKHLAVRNHIQSILQVRK
jgi:hypothetical protein